MSAVNDYPKLSTVSTAWTLGGSLFITVLAIALFYFQTKEDHKWIEETGRPHVEIHERQKDLKEFQYNQIIETLKEIKDDIKVIKEKKR